MHRRTLVLGLVVVVGVAGGALFLAQRPGAQTPVSNAPPVDTRLVPVLRTTLVATQPVSGLVGSSETWAVGLPAGSTPEDVASAADAVAATEDQRTAARSALRTATQTRALVLARDAAAITAAPTGPPRQDAVRLRALDRIGQDAAVSTGRAAVTDAERTLAAAERELSNRRRDATIGGATITAITVSGTPIARGEALYALDGHSAVLLLGDTPAWRALREGDVGPDVTQLQSNLLALGFGGTPAIRTDGTFDHPTTLAVIRWQTARHVETSGAILLGDVVFLPAEVRVGTIHVAVGAGAQPGSPILDVASVDEVVKLELDPGLAPYAHKGDAIRFAAPDRTVIAGRITSVGAPAIPADAGQNGPAPQPVVQVVAAADDPAAIAELDGAVLNTDVTTATAPDVLAVPVAALVVLADGGFGVEVAANGTTHFVRVTPGIYDQSMVEITAEGIVAGDQVVVPGA